MSQYLLDTNICIEILRGNEVVEDKILSTGLDDCFISEITVIELKVGEELGKARAPKGKYHNQFVDKFINSMNVLPIHSAIELFAKEKVRLQLAGTPASNNFDLLIGCTAVANNLVMVTDNIKDFKRIDNIIIENWINR